MKKFFKWVGIVFLALIVLVAAMAFLGKGKTEKLTISDVDLSQVPNGTYEGIYDGYRFTNIVAVTLEDHVIVDIDVIKTQREDISEMLAREVIAAQSPKIDAVSGASLDQNAFLKAVENALIKAMDASQD